MLLPSRPTHSHRATLNCQQLQPPKTAAMASIAAVGSERAVSCAAAAAAIGIELWIRPLPPLRHHHHHHQTSLQQSHAEHPCCFAAAAAA